MLPPLLCIHDFSLRSHDKLRYADTDRQGHVNNAVCATLLEAGRVELLYDATEPLAPVDAEFVIAHLSLDFHAELISPGVVEIGTRVKALGERSVRLAQAIFQQGRCAATAETVIVLIDRHTRLAVPLTPSGRARLQALMA